MNLVQNQLLIKNLEQNLFSQLINKQEQISIIKNQKEEEEEDKNKKLLKNKDWNRKKSNKNNRHFI